jgi:hypothetical protein
MTVIARVLVTPLQMQTSQTTQYTASSVRAIIDKATVTNTDTLPRSFSVNIVNNGGSAANSNQIIENRTVHPDETYTCPELVGQVLEPGQFISTVASAVSSLTLRVSGREIS